MRENLVAILEGAILAADQPLSIDRMIALFDGGIERIHVGVHDHGCRGWHRILNIQSAPRTLGPVSYTHLTLPTIYSV